MTKDTLLAGSDTRATPPVAALSKKRMGAVCKAILKTIAIELAADGPLDDAMAAIFNAARQHWTANIDAALDGRDTEGIHQVRVGLRRFRSALALFKKFLPETQRLWLNDEARWLLNELGPARDLDVFSGELLAPLRRTKSKQKCIAALSRAAQTARTVAQNRAHAALSSARYERFMRRLDTWLLGRGWRMGAERKKHNAQDARIGPFAQKAVNKRLIKILSRGKALQALPVAELHRVRIEIKKARYGVDFFQSVLPRRERIKLATALKSLQDSLGHLNDLAVAEEIVEQLTSAAANTAKDNALRQAGLYVVAHHRRAAAEAIKGIAPRWRGLRKCGLL